MEKYSIKILSAAYRNLDNIYEYIANELQTEQLAMNLIDSLEEAIFSLEFMPYRGAKRNRGIFSNKRYRQLFVKNFTIVYHINEVNKQVIIVTVRYSQSEF